jgi:hypothetical protein
MFIGYKRFGPEMQKLLKFQAFEIYSNYEGGLTLSGFFQSDHL